MVSRKQTQGDWCKVLSVITMLLNTPIMVICTPPLNISGMLENIMFTVNSCFALFLCFFFNHPVQHLSSIIFIPAFEKCTAVAISGL